MDRLFLDANVLFSAAYRPDAGLLRLWKLRHAVLCSSHYAIEEARINLENEHQRARLNQLAAVIELFEPEERGLLRRVSLPDKDLPILQAAIAARATHLLTGDIRHFGPYMDREVEGIVVMLPGEYLKRRTTND
jgi:uncharacterized protein